MPVILDPASKEMSTWLDPTRKTWSKELQSILKPYEGELECYPVPKEVGKVGNNSPNFIVPVDSKENKSNIANFFANAAKKETAPPDLNMAKDERLTKDSEWSEDNAPKPTPTLKREHSPEEVVHTEERIQQKVDVNSKASPHKKKLRSATHNNPMKKSTGTKAAAGSQPITKFFKK
jgi:hypothetical protein